MGFTPYQFRGFQIGFDLTFSNTVEREVLFVLVRPKYVQFYLEVASEGLVRYCVEGVMVYKVVAISADVIQYPVTE
jgi:hypothetical protein